LLLREAILPDGKSVDVRVAGGHITEVAAGGTLSAPADEQCFDLMGATLLAGLVEPHAHLDKAFTAADVPNETYDLAGAISAWLANRPRFTQEQIVDRARAAAWHYLAHGVTAIRSHTDLGAGIGTKSVEALVAVRDELADLIDIQIVALTGLPLSGPAGADNRAYLRAALELGADVVGGAAYLDDDPKQCLDIFAQTASDFGRPIDLHVDETTDSGRFTLPDLIDLARSGFAHAITASHCVSLGSQPPAAQSAVAEAAASAGVSVVTLPLTNLYLQARGTVPPPRGLTALRPLLDAGVTVAAGGDNLRDPFNPMGRADPLETASLLVTAGHLQPAEALWAVTHAARTALRLGPGRIEAGAVADLVAIPGTTVAEVIAAAHPARLVVKAGRVVARTSTTTEIDNVPEAKVMGRSWSR
jgi:cytosine deaminase